jgi:polysaccharide biosynthesis/export protein
MRFFSCLNGALGRALLLCPISAVLALAIPTPAYAQGGVSSAETYVLRPQDGLVFRIVGEPETDTEARIAGDGTITLPFIGTVRVGGMTVQEARRHLAELYDRDFFVNPQIQLLVTFYAERRVQVLGEVNRPGFVVIPPEERMTLLQAIAGAGGFTRIANQRDVQIKRTNAQGETETYRVNVADILRGTGSQDVPVLKGDTIVISERVF